MLIWAYLIFRFICAGSGRSTVCAAQITNSIALAYFDFSQLPSLPAQTWLPCLRLITEQRKPLSSLPLETEHSHTPRGVTA